MICAEDASTSNWETRSDSSPIFLFASVFAEFSSSIGIWSHLTSSTSAAKSPCSTGSSFA